MWRLKRYFKPLFCLNKNKFVLYSNVYSNKLFGHGQCVYRCLPYTFSKLRWLSLTKLDIRFQKLNFLSMIEWWFADVGKVAISLYQGVQSQALQLVGGLFSWHGDCGKVCFKVLSSRNWGMAAFHFFGDIHKDVLVGRDPLLQPRLAFCCSHLGNNRL